MNGPAIRSAAASDAAAVEALVARAFGGFAEAQLVGALRMGHAVLELVAEREGVLLGHVLFSRLWVEGPEDRFAAVALAPLAVESIARNQGIAGRLIEEGHARLRNGGETLSVVLGDPRFYGRFGYSHARAGAFDSAYQCEALQALAWTDDAPQTGRLIYAPAFAAL